MPKYKNIFQLSKRGLKGRYYKYNKHHPYLPSNNLIDPQTETSHYFCENVALFEDSEEESTLSELEYSSDFDDSAKNSYQIENIETFLTKWTFRYNIRRNALNTMIKFLKTNGFPTLPADSRTLLKTPKTRTVIQIAPGHYIHIGVKNSLHKFLSKFQNNFPQVLLLDINIDGVKISKSSSSGFWVILLKPYIVGNNFNDSIYVVGLYHGYKDPDNFSELISPFVEELKEISEGNFIFKEKPIHVKMRAFICDAPARCHILGTKSHSAYFGCGKCTQEGYYYKDRMTFPEQNAPLRTNESFRNKTDEYYHTVTSPIERLDVDLVRQVPLEYLHTVLIGAVKKMIKIWSSGKHSSRLPTRDIYNISELLLKISKTQPCEFQRKLTSIENLAFMKGTQLRTFLLYSGPYVLKGILPIDLYNHFLLLHVAIRILCDKDICISHNELANEMLREFVFEMEHLYGLEHIIYNIHSLIHLANDVKVFGNLDNFSAFVFESSLYKLKNLLHKTPQPLAQIANRIEENEFELNYNVNNQDTFPLLKKRRHILCNNNHVITTVYKEIITEKFKLSNEPADCWFLTKKNNIVRFEHLECIENQLFILGSEVPKKEDFYKTPISSHRLNIYQATFFLNPSKLWNLKEVHKKLFSIDDGNRLVFFPLIHN